MNAIATILHPTDFSELSKKVLRRVLAAAKGSAAQVIVLHVREPQEIIEGEFGMPLPEPEPADEMIFADLQALVPAEAGVKAEAMLAHGVVAEEIVRVAVARHCDLIMLASHGHTGFLSRLFHTNISQQIKRDAPCPVIALTAEAIAEPGLAVSLD